MGHFLLTIFLCYPIQHTSTSVIVEVHIDIRQRDTVRIQETLKQQVVFNRVNLRNPQTIGHCRTGSRTTTRPYRHIQFLTGSPNKVLHDQEIPRETHGLHNMKFELDTFACFFIQHFPITSVRTFQSQLFQIVGFQFDTIQLIIATQFFNFTMGSILAQHHVTIFVPCKLIKQIFFRIFLSIAFFRSEIFRNLKVRHNRSMVNAIKLYLVANCSRIRQCLRDIGKQFIHLRLGFHPLLLGI